MADTETTPEVEETEESTTAPEVEETDEDPEGAEALGDPGKKALDAMKAQRNEARKAARELTKRLEALEKPAAENDLDAIKAEAEKAANEKANTRIVRAEIRAAAAGKLADPTDAALYIDASQFEVDENGEVDSEEIAEAITELLTRKPHLAGTATGRFQGSADQGARKQPPRPSQLSRADLAKMSPESIVKAKKDGRLNDVLGIK